MPFSFYICGANRAQTASLLRFIHQIYEALRYKPEGRGFDSRCCHCNFSLT